MKTYKQIEAEIRGVFDSAKWDKHFTKTASKIVEEIRKENGFSDFTIKERVAILESIAQCVMNISFKQREEIKKLKRDNIFLMIITGLFTGLLFGILIRGFLG